VKLSTAAGKPRVVTGAAALKVEWDAVPAVPDVQLKRIACNVSQPWIGAELPAALKVASPLGRIAVPKFFWGGADRQGDRQLLHCLSLEPDGCLARSVAAIKLKKRVRSAIAVGH
jgi:hypothetical protein